MIDFIISIDIIKVIIRKGDLREASVLEELPALVEKDEEYQ